MDKPTDYLQEAANSISSANSIVEALTGLTKGVTRVLAVTGTMALLVDKKREHLHGQIGMPAEVWPHARKITIGMDDLNSVAVIAVRTKSPVVVSDQQKDSRGLQWLARFFGARSVLAVPIIFDEKPLGAIVAMESRQAREFSENDISQAQLLSALAGQVLNDITAG